MRAVQDLGQGLRPSIRRTAAAALRALPFVAVVVLLVTLGVIGGLLLLLVPGIILSVRWFVATQVAVVESPWRASQALCRSAELIAGSWWRVFGIVLVIIFIPAVTLGFIGVPLHLSGVDFDEGWALLLSRLVSDTLTLSFVALGGRFSISTW